MSVAARAHGTTGRVLARRYKRNDRKVVRIIRFTAVFLALMTPRAPRKGWCDPPMAASSFESAINRCTLIGIHVALAMACQSLIVAGSVAGVISRGGVIM